ncbi:sigma-70 family RNA polymerase sigma factor [Mesorhizobium sp. NBSH29]|uniref:RNA polymerase sigma factor n=1 Tax=Mesorhizobium sp. NBSH29 TaxID=2654249 RepID=UPI0018968746|nr:RNA polymerase sigma factor [Mesorhizobium sp. NBSH29]QPC86918.1 sigma-70 family RNA polymerase sigma factor [Mesorhizobium sp. NBSH29]
MKSLGWIDEALAAARPQAVGALLRYFRDLDTAEDAYQEACVRALKSWPEKGLPRDPAAWLIFVGRNAALDVIRRRSKQQSLPPEDLISDLEDVENSVVEDLDNAHYRDDILRLLFVCCHPDLPANQQIAMALRIVSGLSVREIARAFLITEKAMEQRITRAKRRVGEAGISFSVPDARERAARLGTVASMIYLVFNEGYSASGGSVHVRVALCDEALRLARILLSIFPGEPEIMGLTALLLMQHSRTLARLDADNRIVLLQDQDRRLWNHAMIAEGGDLVRKARAMRRPGPYQIQSAIAAVHAEAPTAEDTDWAQIDQLYGVLQRVQPSPVIELNRAVAVAKLHGPAAALALVEPLGEHLLNYFHFYGVKAVLLKDLGRTEEAREAFNRALALANTAAEAEHIRMQIAGLSTSQKPAHS